MQWLIRTGCWVCCGEVLLWTRGFLPPRMLFLMGAMLAVRLTLIAALPHYALAMLFWRLTAGLFVLRYLLALGKRSRRLRAHYQVPETGLPWTACLTGPRPAPTLIGSLLFEPAFALAVVYVILTQSQGMLLPEAEWRGLVPYEVELALRPYLAVTLAWARVHATTAALLQLVIPVAVLVLHNLYEWHLWSPRAPRERPSQAPGQAMRPGAGQEPRQDLAFDPVWVQRR